MISSALLLTTGLLASPVIIEDVQAAREAGHLRVEVSAAGGIDPDGARTKLEQGQLLIYLGGTRVKADNRAWDLADGSGEIRAHRHKSETELVVPLAGNGCSGPVELQGSETGITALVGCEGGAVGTAAAPPMSKSKAAPKTEQLKALVELPEEAKAPDAKSVPKAETKVEAKLPVKVDTKTATNAETTTEAKAETKPQTKTEPKLEMSATDTVAPGVARAGVAGGGLRSIGLPALLLGALAVGAYLFARRRRTISVRHIQILETASLGPKRSLVVARVGEETLILGTSEAGITLLKGAAAGVGTTAPAAATAPVSKVEAVEDEPSAATRAEADASAFEISQPLEEALADIPEPDATPTPARGGFRAIEGGLAGLFNRRREEAQPETEDELHERFEARLQARLASRRPSRLDDKNFENVLEDSLEDQELRQKLAAGMSARVR